MIDVWSQLRRCTSTVTNAAKTNNPVTSQRSRRRNKFFHSVVGANHHGKFSFNKPTKMYTLFHYLCPEAPFASVCARNYSKPPLITSESCRRYNASSAKTSSYLINLSPDSCESLSSLLVVWHGGWAEGLNGDSRGPTLLPLVHTPTRGRTEVTVPPWWKPVTG